MLPNTSLISASGMPTILPSGHAIAHKAIIITKDEDFPQRMRQAKSSPVIVWLRIGNTSRRALVEWFEPLLPQVETLITQGDRLIEIR